VLIWSEKCQNKSALIEEQHTIGGHRSRRKQRLHRFRYLPETKLNRLHRSRYLPLKRIETVLSFSLCALKKTETDQSFFLLLFLENVTVNRSRYGIELKKRNGKIISVTLLLKKVERLHRSRCLVFLKNGKFTSFSLKI
jgi:hypothetical protein